MRESAIVYERGLYWVYKEKTCYTVYKPYQSVACIADSSYPLDEDGLSIAKARADYLQRRNIEKETREVGNETPKHETGQA